MVQPLHELKSNYIKFISIATDKIIGFLVLNAFLKKRTNEEIKIYILNFICYKAWKFKKKRKDRKNDA